MKLSNYFLYALLLVIPSVDKGMFNLNDPKDSYSLVFVNNSLESQSYDITPYTAEFLKEKISSDYCYRIEIKDICCFENKDVQKEFYNLLQLNKQAQSSDENTYNLFKTIQDEPEEAWTSFYEITSCCKMEGLSRKVAEKFKERFSKKIQESMQKGVIPFKEQTLVVGSSPRTYNDLQILTNFLKFNNRHQPLQALATAFFEVKPQHGRAKTEQRTTGLATFLKQETIIDSSVLFIRDNTLFVKQGSEKEISLFTNIGKEGKNYSMKENIFATVEEGLGGSNWLRLWKIESGENGLPKKTLLRARGCNNIYQIHLFSGHEVLIFERDKESKDTLKKIFLGNEAKDPDTIHQSQYGIEKFLVNKQQTHSIVLEKINLAASVAEELLSCNLSVYDLKQDQWLDKKKINGFNIEQAIFSPYDDNALWAVGKKFKEKNGLLDSAELVLMCFTIKAEEIEEAKEYKISSSGKCSSIDCSSPDTIKVLFMNGESESINLEELPKKEMPVFTNNFRSYFFSPKKIILSVWGLFSSFFSNG